MRLWHWKLVYNDPESLHITRRAAVGTWTTVSDQVNEDRVTEEIEDYIYDVFKIHAEDLVSLNVFEDEEKYLD